MIGLATVEILTAGQLQIELFEIASEEDRLRPRVAAAREDIERKRNTMNCEAALAANRRTKLSTSYMQDLAKEVSKLAALESELQTLLDLAGACNARLTVLANQEVRP